MLNPASGRTPGRPAVAAAAAGRRRETCPGSASPRCWSTTAGRPACAATASCSPPTPAGRRSHDHAGVEDPRTTWIPSLGVHVMTYVAVRPAGPATGARRVARPARLAAARPGALRVPAGPRHRPEPVPQQGRRVLPRAGARARTAGPRTRCCTARCGTSAGSSGGERRLPAGRARRPPAGNLDLLRPGRRGASATCARSPTSGRTGSSRCPSTTTRRSRSAPARRRCASRRAGCSSTTACPANAGRGLGAAAARALQRRRDAARPDDPGRVLARTAQPAARTARPPRSATAPCPTSSSRPPSRRSTGNASSSTAWPTPAIGVARLDVLREPRPALGLGVIGAGGFAAVRALGGRRPGGGRGGRRHRRRPRPGAAAGRRARAPRGRRAWRRPARTTIGSTPS